MPDDGNKYELLHGELFVTPAPTIQHQVIIARLARILEPYVAGNGLGLVFQARAVVRFAGNEAEPDLYVNQYRGQARWDDAPTPSLVVEGLSDSTRQRDLDQKRRFYLDEVRVPEYWIIDPEARSVRVTRAGQDDSTTAASLSWHPVGATHALAFEVAALFA